MSFTARDYIRAQMAKLPYPTKSFNGQTIIVTGANIGLGLEAARHFVRLDAEKVILAVRSKSKGSEAARSIEASTGRKGVVEVWDLDLSRYPSVSAFAERVQTLDRVDVVVENAGMRTWEFSLDEDNESTVTVNVVSTLLLGILLVPKLRETSVRFDKETVLTFVGSFVHFMTEFPERANVRILESLADKKNARVGDRYNVSKLTQLLLSRELATVVSQSAQPGSSRIAINIVNPAHVATNIIQNASFLFSFWMKILNGLMARSSEEGARTLVHAAEGGPETHGQYLSECKVSHVSGFVASEEGHKTQKKLWAELAANLDRVHPGAVQAL